MKKQRSNPSLVRPSRDGDQFHYLWAARRCLSLLSSQSEMVAISIEGVSPSELSTTTEEVAGEEQIDITEYYGDERIEFAKCIRYIQLKHSSRRTRKKWTASGLRRTLAQFATRYKDLSNSIGDDELSRKLEFWFVTNRSISARLMEAVDDEARGRISRHPEERKKLVQFTDLNESNLSSFCRLIRFEDRQDDYWDQRNILVQEVSGYLPDFDVDAPTQLKELVTRKALSESEQDPVITRMDVLRALKTDETRLFPKPCLINPLDNAVPREQEASLLRRIVQAESRPVVVHALAGVGKTVFCTRLATRLPRGSVSILYDCFGNGEYRSATGYRHRHHEALVQIANELASQGLCHPLIPTAHADTSAYVRAFVYRLRQAVTIIRHASRCAVLCIVVDAGDNAQMAAEEIGQPRSFVRDLLHEALPSGVRLVVLCRSHRRDILEPPRRTLTIELEPFSRAETSVHLRHTFPDATEQDVGEFHRLSSQNPRVQALALSRGLSLAETLRRLGPNPTTVDSSIGRLLDGVVADLRDGVGPVERNRIDKICAALAVLRPRVPITLLSQVSGVSEEAVRSFALDLGRPVLLSGDSVQFLDEPVETWFREKFRPSPEEMNKFIRKLTPLAEHGTYAASTLPQLMLEAGQFSDLVSLALTSKALPEASEIERRDVELHRLQFALKASLRLKRYVDASKLALKAGGETAGDDRQRKLIQSNTDLAAIFVEPEIVQELVSRGELGSKWVGSHHAYEAGLLSGRVELIDDARSRLRMAFEWVRNWIRLPSEQRDHERVEDADIAELAAAQLNIHGAVTAARFITGWQPREIVFRVGRIVARRLVDHGRFADLNDLARAAGNNLCLVLSIILELGYVQRMPAPEVIRRAFQLIANSRVRLELNDRFDSKDEVLDAVTAVLEFALKLSLCSRTEAEVVLSRYLPETPPRDLVSRFSGTRTCLLRAYCLRAELEDRPLQIMDLAHPELRKKIERESQHDSSREILEFKEGIGALSPWYQLLAATLLRKVAKEELGERLEQTRAASAKASHYGFSDNFRTQNEIVLVWFEILNYLVPLDSNLLDSLTHWIGGLTRPLYTTTLIALARVTGRREEARALGLEFAAEAFSLLRDERIDAESKASDYLEIARSVLTASPAEAKAYFNEAMVVASRIGEENLARWSAILDLAIRAAQKERPLPKVAYRFARCAELTYEYVVRDKHFDWSSTVTVLSLLCPRSAIAILSRWRDRDFGYSKRILPLAIHTLIDHDEIDPRDAVALIGFVADWNYSKLLDTVLRRCKDRHSKEDACAALFPYIKWEKQSSSVWKHLSQVVKRHGLSVPDLDAYIEYTEREECISNRKEMRARGVRAKGESVNFDWDEVFSGRDLATVEGVSGAHSASRHVSLFHNFDEFFREAFRRVSVGMESSFLECVENCPDFNLYQFRTLLEQLPENWKKRQSVKHSLTAMTKTFCRRYCMDIIRSQYYEPLPFDLVHELTDVEESEFIAVVLDAIGESPELVDANRLFSLVGLLKSELDCEQALEGLTFGLNLFEPILEDKDGDGPWSVDLSPPESMQDSVAGYVFAGLAAPSSKLRWEAAHATLILCKLGRDKVLNQLIELIGDSSWKPFVDKNLPFYRLHALQWLLISLARATKEVPSVLAPYATTFIELALNGESHVLIRQFAARAALAFTENEMFPGDDQVIRRLKEINVSSLPVLESKSYERGNQTAKGPPREDDEDRFYFGIDIGPYWYAPLGRVFALSQNDIETRALEVIREEFNYTGTKTWRTDERARRKLYDHRQTYATHGAYPSTDDFQFYLSYHAMMIVAGKLLSTTPTHRDTEWYARDEFSEWLAGHDLSRSDGRWLADRRDPVPLERSGWRDRKSDATEHGEVMAIDFDEVLMAGEMLTVWGHWKTADFERVQTINVRSALVAPDRSRSLLRALSTVEDPYFYCIPGAGDDMEIDRSGFILKGWIENRDSHSGLDGKDYWSGGVRFPPPIPATEIVELMNLDTDVDLRVWYDTEKEPVVSSQVWGHREVGEQDDGLEDGERLRATTGFVRKMLSNTHMDLIVEVVIERRGRKHGYGNRRDDDERMERTARIYLVSADGSVASL